jgi:hypothetical protein
MDFHMQATIARPLQKFLAIFPLTTITITRR